MSVRLVKTSWKDSAACQAADREIFYNESVFLVRAKSLCFRCPVLEPCLEAALERDERWGVWGGLTARERRRYVHVTDWEPGQPIQRGWIEEVGKFHRLRRRAA
jgi:Transcription factor WhiB